MKNVKIIGYVENVVDLFFYAKAFICPIFSGAGMKVKIAEALMYGKTIIGTSFACIGYEIDSEVFYLHNTTKSLIECLNHNSIPFFNQKARDLFLKKYDFKQNSFYYKSIKTSYEEWESARTSSCNKKRGGD